MKYFLIIFLVLVSFLEAGAQSYPVFSQYMRNGLALNPAYAGSKENFAVSLVYRQQWTGFNGSPVTQVFNAHAPLKKDRVALGLMAFNDTYGPYRNTGIFANYAFRIRMGKGTLSLGLKGGVYLQEEDQSDFRPVDQNDPVIQGGVYNYTIPNFGAGIYYYSNRFYMGVSVPALLSSHGSELYHDFYNYDILVTSGILIRFSDKFKFKPSFLVNFNLPSSFQVDINGNFIFGDFLWLGGSWRIQDETIVGMIELQLTPQFGIGYSYDYSSGTLNSFNSGSHEVVLRYLFGYKVKATNPRYF